MSSTVPTAMTTRSRLAATSTSLIRRAPCPSGAERRVAGRRDRDGREQQHEQPDEESRPAAPTALAGRANVHRQ